MFIRVCLVLCAVVGVSAAIAVVFFVHASLTIATPPIALLPPHKHSEGDAATDRGHGVMTSSPIVVAPDDLWVTDIEVAIENAPDIMLHHALFVDVDKRSVECPSYNARELLVFGQDQLHDSTLQFPDGYALFLPKGTRLRLDVMLHNPEPPLGPGGTYDDVSVRVRLTGARWWERDLKPLSFNLLHLEDAPCETMQRTFTVPPHVEGYRIADMPGTDGPATMVFEKRGTIVYMGAHLHGWQGGKSLTVTKNGADVTTFTTTPSTVPYRYDTPHYETRIPVEIGDTFSIEAIYDNPHDMPTRGAMGIWGFFFAEATPTVGTATQD